MISSKLLNGLNGVVVIPGDKSISHRSIILPSISNGRCEINNLLKSQDVLHTIDAFKQMGVKIFDEDNKTIIEGKGLGSLLKSKTEIYLGNSGTSARLLIGLLSSQKFNSEITGDESLSSRPMKRISDPLSLMGANISTSNGSLPIKILGRELNNATINITIPSAQIKSGLILAALNTNGITTLIENNVTRDHTEIMLEEFDADINIENIDQKKIIKIKGKKELHSKNIEVPSDLSSSAFFIIAALINKNSELKLNNININPTRNGILQALDKMGANIHYINKRKINNELVCDIIVKSSSLNGCELDGNIAKLMIDEYPILSIAAAFANSPSIFKGLTELRVKESDRLELIKHNLTKCGVDCEIIGDDLIIKPNLNSMSNNVEIKTDYDHRIAMAFSVMGSKIGPLKIDQPDCINTSFPTFIDQFNKVGGYIS